MVYLSLSTHHKKGGVGLPYVRVQGTPALVWRVAGFFRAGGRAEGLATWVLLLHNCISKIIPAW